MTVIARPGRPDRGEVLAETPVVGTVSDDGPPSSSDHDVAVPAVRRRLTERLTQALGRGLGVGHGRLGRRRVELLCSLVLAAIAFGQATGRVVVDTKLDLTVDPARFLANATHLWDPLQFFGSIQNQAYGYLFPMGPYFAIGHALGIAPWIVERSWLCLLLLTALWGTVFLAEELGLGGPRSRVVGGMAYTLSPMVLSTALTSADLLPIVLLPWVMLPLVRAGHGKTSPGAAAARSGVAVLCMGGVNAAATGAVLVMPIVWFLTRRRGTPGRWKLLGAWLLAVLAATLWFLVGSAYQAKYGFDFVPFTETAADTTRLASLGETLRGAGMWLSLNDVNGIWTPAGWAIETVRPVILATAGIAGAGLWGLVRRGPQERRFLALTCTVGVLLICAGYWGHLGAPLAPVVHRLFFGPLAALRNVYKFEPLVGLPLALGLVCTCSAWRPAIEGWMARVSLHRLSARRAQPVDRGTVVPGGTRRLLSSRRERPSSRPRPRRLVLTLGTVAILGLLGVAALPALTGQLYPEGSYPSLPGYWNQAMAWINARGSLSTTLLLPGAAFGKFDWGTTNDQPAEPLAAVPWAGRDIAPLGSIGNTEFLDTVDQVLVGGQPVPGLAQYLSRAGVRYVVVENDLNTAETGSPPPGTMAALLSSEPDIQLVAEFGRPSRATDGVRPIDIYRVTSTSSAQAMVTTYPLSSGVELSGGPGAELEMADAGILGNEAVALTGDPLAPRFSQTTWVDTDNQQRRDIQFGLLYDDASYVLAPGAPAPGGGPVDQWTVVDGTRHETTAEIHGAATVTASSYGATVGDIAGYQPLGAFVADPGPEAWVVAGTNTHNPWIQIRFNHPIPLSHITVSPMHDGPWRPTITRIQVTTAQGSTSAPLVPQQRPQVVPTAPGETSFLRITLTGIAPAIESSSPAGPGLAHVGIPGVTVTESLRVPDDGSGSGGTLPSYLFDAPLPNGFSDLSAPDDQPHLSRNFTTPVAGTYRVAAVVAPRPSPQLLSLAAGPSSVSASSTSGSLPVFGPSHLEAGQAGSWVAAAGDPNPTVTYTLPTTTTLSTLDYEVDLSASRPTEALLVGDHGQRRLVHLPVADATVSFPPMRTSRVTISFPQVQRVFTYSVFTHSMVPEPLGASELSFPQALLGGAPAPQEQFVLPCGQGPALEVDGHTYPTAVDGSYGDLVGLVPMPLELCTPGSALSLPAGAHSLQALDADGAFKITTVSLLGSPTSTEAGGQRAQGTGAGTTMTGSTLQRHVTLGAWGDEHRSLSASPGPAVLLAIHQNYNAGWIATVDGRRLKSVRLDGWQQAYELPASAVRQHITLTYVPGVRFRLSLVCGAVLASVLVVWAILPEPRRRRRAQKPVDALRRPLPPAEDQARRFWPGVVIITVVLYLLAGPMALAVPAALLARWAWNGVARRRRAGERGGGERPTSNWLPWLALSAEIAAGIAIAAYLNVYASGPVLGSLGWVEQACGAMAILALLFSLLPSEPRRAASS